MGRDEKVMEIKVFSSGTGITDEVIDRVKVEFGFDDLKMCQDFCVFVKIKGQKKSPLADLVI